MANGITRYVMIGEESQYGLEASNFPETLDPESASIDPAGDDKLIYEGISGLDRLAKPGLYSTAGSITLPLDDKATGWFWKWALGGYEKQGSAPAVTHIFTPKRQALMPSFTVKIGKDFMEHIFLGNVIESIELSLESEWALMTVNVIGAKDKKGPLATDVTFTEGNVFTASMASFEKNGVDVSAGISALTLSIETGADIESSQGFASRFPRKAFMGSLVVTTELTLGFESEDELLAFWGGSDGPSIDTVQEVSYTIHFGDTLDIVLPRLVYTGATQPVEGRGVIQQTVSARALLDPSTYEGPIIVTLTNDKETY